MGLKSFQRNLAEEVEEAPYPSLCKKGKEPGPKVGLKKGTSPYPKKKTQFG